MLDKKTGAKVFHVMAMWQMYHTNKKQVIYMMAPVKSHTKPALIELKKAIHCLIVAPTGTEHGCDISHRPSHIYIANRYIYSIIYFNSI